MHLKPQILLQQFSNIHNSSVALFRLIDRFEEIGVHNFSNNFTFFILVNEDMLLPYPVDLVPFLPQVGQSLDHISQYLGDRPFAEGTLSLIDHPKISLKSVVWSFEYGIDIGDNRAEVVGLHGMRINQPDHMRTLILLKLAELNEQLVMLLRAVGHHLLYDVSVPIFWGE